METKPTNKNHNGGTLSLRISPEVHQLIRNAAHGSGQSINNWLSRLVIAHLAAIAPPESKKR